MSNNGFSHDNETAAPHFYEILKHKAIEGRLEPTTAETRLWQCLRGNKLGVKFRRQHVIGDCIADFICIKERLIVEVDGPYHFTKEQQEEDRFRTDYLKNLEYRVIRFTNDEVIYEIDKVLHRIKDSFVFTDVTENPWLYRLKVDIICRRNK